MRVLYLFSGTRSDKFRGAVGRDYPDTQFYGLNHLACFGIHAESKEFSDIIPSRAFARIIGFRLRHVLMFFATRGYDVVFGSSLMYMLCLKKIFGSRAKFVLLNMGLTRTLSANKNRPVRLWVLCWLLKELSAIVCLSHTQQKFLEDRLPFLRGRIFFVPLGVDTEYYQPHFAQRKKYILSVGRDNGRDYKTVVEAAKRMPDRNFEIVCSERNLVGIQSFPPNLRMTYDLPIVELHQKYQEAQMMLLITHDDTFLDGSDCSGQTVLLDAMASGIPIIVSRKKYLEDYARDGQDVLVVNFYDADDIVQKIKACESDAVRLALAKNARARAENFYSTKSMAQALAHLFISLAS